MNNSQVAHVWAQQTRPRGKGSNFWFEGPTIYSYGRHFPIAKWVTGVEGRRAVLFTTRDYSNTTTQHKWLTRRAIAPGTPVFFVPDPENSDHVAALRDYVRRIETKIAAASRARSRKATLLDTAERLCAEALDYARFFGVEPPAVLNPPPEIIEAAARYRCEVNAREAAERAARVAEQTAKLGEWRVGQYRGPLYDIPCALRYNSSEHRIETSHGAHVPVGDCLRLWPLIQRRRVHGQRVGEFTAESVTDGILTVGCHRIPLTEVEAMAETLRACGVLE